MLETGPAKRERFAPQITGLGLDRPAMHAAARAAREQGQGAQAEALYRWLLECFPEDAEALHWLGVLEHLGGRHEIGRDFLERALVHAPENAQARFHYAEMLRESGQPGAAVEQYLAAARLAPERADIWFGLGSARLDDGATQGAVDALEEAVRLAPDDQEIADALRRAHAELVHEAGNRQRDAGWLMAAIDLYRQAIATDPGHARAWNNLGTCFERRGELAMAADAYAKALEVDPDLAEAHLNLGICRAVEGDRDATRRSLEAALTLKPTLGLAHYHLALLDRAEGVCDAGIVGGIEAMLARPDLDRDIRTDLEFALAHRLDAMGACDEAFAHLDRANRRRHAKEPFDLGAHERFVEAMIETLDGGFFGDRWAMGETSELPILVVGMPRSGTTLVEAVLAAHPEAAGAGERDELRELVRNLTIGGHALPSVLARMTAAEARNRGAWYVNRLRSMSASARRIVDKMPGNYLRLGVLGLILPRARIVWCRRHPMDCALSCYFQNFAHGLRFSYDLHALGRVIRLEERLMRHWQQVLPNPILELDYEALVGDPEPAVRHLLDFAGLDPDPACLAFTGSKGPVRTSSLWQTRQPIHGRALGRWRRYAAHLGPLEHALNPERGREGEGDGLVPGPFQGEIARS